MAMYTISKAETPKSFDKKDGSGEGQMQKIVLRDDAGKDFRCTIFSPDETFVGDIVEATMKNYNEKFKEYQFTVKTVTPGPRGIPNTPKEPKVSVEGEKGASNSRSPEDTLKIVRQATLKVVGGAVPRQGRPGEAGYVHFYCGPNDGMGYGRYNNSPHLQGGEGEPCDAVRFRRGRKVRGDE